MVRYGPKNNYEKLIYYQQIKNLIIESLRRESDQVNDYETRVINNWKRLATNIRSLYHEDFLIGWANPRRNECFLFHSDLISYKEEIALEVLVLTEHDNIDYAVRAVLWELKIGSSPLAASEGINSTRLD